jgi:D-alanine--D-alanine ligase
MNLSDAKYERLPLAIIYGGRGAEREISKKSAESFIGLCRKADIPILRVLIDADGSFYIESEEEIPKISEKVLMGGDRSSEICVNTEESGDIARKTSNGLYRIPTYPVRLFGKSGFLVGGEVIEVRGAFPILHGDFGEDGTVQGALTTAGIKLFGADTLSGAITTDKIYTKIIAEHYGVKTVPFVTLFRGDISVGIASSEALGYPVIVKPVSLGSSIGISAAYNRTELSQALKLAFSYSERAVCEKLIEDKRELECAYFSVGDRRIITPPAEVLVKGFYDYDKKYRLPTEVIPVADVGGEVKEKIIKMTDDLARSLSVKHIARFDYFLLHSGEIFLNEINACPGMTDSSLYIRMLGKAGLSGSQLVSLIYGDLSW